MYEMKLYVRAPSTVPKHRGEERNAISHFISREARNRQKLRQETESDGQEILMSLAHIKQHDDIGHHDMS